MILLKYEFECTRRAVKKGIVENNPKTRQGYAEKIAHQYKAASLEAS